MFGVGVRFKNIFGTYLCSQSTLVLEVQPYLFAFTSAKFWGFFALFGPLGAILGVEVRFKTLFGTHLCRQSTLVLDIAILMKTKSSAFDFDFDWRFWACQFLRSFWGKIFKFVRKRQHTLKNVIEIHWDSSLRWWCRFSLIKSSSNYLDSINLLIFFNLNILV